MNNVPAGKAPFTEEQVSMIKELQKGDFFHPYTCFGCEPCRPLKVNGSGLYCRECGHQQNWVPCITDRPKKTGNDFFDRIIGAY